eukprot:2329092-Rhodomonas_salina.1
MVANGTDPPVLSLGGCDIDRAEPEKLPARRESDGGLFNVTLGAPLGVGIGGAEPVRVGRGG